LTDVTTHFPNLLLEYPHIIYILCTTRSGPILWHCNIHTASWIYVQMVY